MPALRRTTLAVLVVALLAFPGAVATALTIDDFEEGPYSITHLDGTAEQTGLSRQRRGGVTSTGTYEIELADFVGVDLGDIHQIQFIVGLGSVDDIAISNIAVVPEPGSLLLLSAAILASACWRRLRGLVVGPGR